ncbi:hypothetical protein [Arthrobacter sp.]|uniref:hypothetical protein n=1 Tax=Arthrobacter sp. TaxID=1667 RepID=UPI003A93FD74
MTTTPNRQRRGVPRWVWVLVGLAVAIALVVGVSMVFSKNRANTATPAPTPAPSASSAATAGADGCIAGRDNDAKSLIAGAKEQPQTEAGAAATAAGFMRFTYQYPWPSQSELTSSFSALSIAKDPKDAAEAAQEARSAPGPENARTGGMSFADARYVIEPTSTTEKVQIAIAAQSVADGVLNGNSVAMTLTMNWDDGVWRFADLQDGRSAEEILSQGTAFVGGC